MLNISGWVTDDDDFWVHYTFNKMLQLMFLCVYVCFVLVGQGLPDPETVSSSIQQMWALTEIMQASQTAASIGRFDVSYTIVYLYHYLSFELN